MTYQNFNKRILVLSVFLFFLSFTQVNAQCAGADNSVTVCNKEQDTDNRTYDLFAALGGTPLAGGTWTALAGSNSTALNEATGEVDLWQIYIAGTHQFQYDNPLCGESAIVTLSLGGYPGQDNIDGGANACNNENDVNLYSFLGSNQDGQVQDINGVWSEDAPTGALTDNTFDATQVTPGEYTFRYTSMAVGSCPAREAVVILEVHRVPVVGTPETLIFCSEDDFSGFTNFNLHNLLVGEDMNGTWSQNDVDLPNQFVDIQDIYNTSGAGVYTYEYSIVPTNLVCDIATVSATIRIRNTFVASVSGADYCIGSPYIVNVNYNELLLPNGSYDIDYTVTGSTGNYDLTASAADLNGGSGSFTMTLPSDVPVNETLDLVVTGITDSSGAEICDLVNTPQTTFSIIDVDGPPSITAEANQTFCTNDYTAPGPTLADIQSTTTGNVAFFETENSTDQLPDTTALIDGEDYFLSSTDSTNSCIVATRVQVTVALITPTDPTTSDSSPIFCGSDNPTIADLPVDAPNGETVLWYDAASGGTELAATTALTTSTSYFATYTYSSGCESTNRVEVTPTVVAVESASLQFTSLALCALDQPSVAQLREIENSTDFDVQWYDQPQDGTPLADSELLVSLTTYYAETSDPDTGCSLPDRVAVTVDLSNCDPVAYDFFIPDGFSPNGDGRNDTYFIPNIELIFPQFTFEILNRYGTSVFKGDIDNPAWDGDQGSGEAPNGIYYYIVNYNKDGFEPIQGRLYLNR
ncbi:gliding motility-associated C-terminal domain-containing protein [Aurantibacter crassamenti]|uniref:gliding motility-associated C-terminal domain-containing protein n=1 Tax=Aurantibacter crassamenti TaxID=1837375 RepID=UPI00193995E9|nr:gliding motility-associated C-terminal domain-containing protein [Aurantibacter crassamenti]MBM1106094.1 gliding motility-associated C-terminal domain-containing protein [Aurantibacter crassamenti]